YVLWQNFNSQSTNAVSTTQGTQQNVSQTSALPPDTAPIASAPTTTPPVAPTPVPVPPPQPQGQYANGTYIGSTANAYYGLVQVEAVIQGGQLADVKFLQYPSDRSTSRYINSQAMPLLSEEAIQAQSANIDGVSGATDTSGAFIQSLSFALAQAKP
ncbi:MAG: FMN-binding protein, partial [Minisyncoccia bacterium]